MRTFILGTALTLALAAAPASAQLLGGGGGGGMLGGTLGGGGSLGGAGGLGSTLERSRIGNDTLGSARASSRTERNVDRRSGRVNARNQSSAGGALDSATRLGDQSLTGTSAASGDTDNGVDAQLIGTDRARGIVGETAGTARGAAAGARDRVRDTAEGARNAVPSTGNLAGSASGNVDATGSGMLSAAGGGLSGAGNLAAAGSGAAQAGAFPVSPGMVVRDARGRAVGTVQSVRSTGQGAVERVLVKVGDRTADLPAANFSGSGSALVSGMTRGEVKDAAEDNQGQ